MRFTPPPPCRSPRHHPGYPFSPSMRVSPSSPRPSNGTPPPPRANRTPPPPLPSPSAPPTPPRLVRVRYDGDLCEMTEELALALGISPIEEDDEEEPPPPNLPRLVRVDLDGEVIDVTVELARELGYNVSDHVEFEEKEEEEEIAKDGEDVEDEDGEEEAETEQPPPSRKPEPHPHRVRPWTPPPHDPLSPTLSEVAEFLASRSLAPSQGSPGPVVVVVAAPATEEGKEAKRETNRAAHLRAERRRGIVGAVKRRRGFKLSEAGGRKGKGREGEPGRPRCDWGKFRGRFCSLVQWREKRWGDWRDGE